MEKQQNKKPLVRFPEFKDSWEHKRLNELLCVSKATNTDLKYSKEEVLSVSGELGIVNQIEHLGRSYAGVSVHNYGVVELNQIVYTKSPLKANPYGIIKLNKYKAGIVSTLYAVYTLKKNTDGNFIEYYFSLDANLNRYLRPLVRKGAKNDMKISDEYVLNDRIYSPTLPEQQKIAHFFTTLDKKIDQLQEKKNALEQYKKGMMQKFFSQEIRFCDDNGKDYPDWEEKKLGEVCEKISSGNSKNSNDGEFDLYGSTGLIGKCDEPSHNGYFLLIARVGANAGQINRKDGEFGVSDNTLVVETKSDISFLYYLLLNFNLNRLIFGSGQPLITGGQLKGLKLYFPTLPEQTKIANFLSKIDDKINTVNEQIEQTKTYKKGLLQKMFV